MPNSKPSLRERAKAELELRRRRADAPPLWKPFPNSPQGNAVESPADITGYGGAAGGGKTDLELGLALTRHHNSIIFRREYPQLRGIVERSRELIGERGRFNSVSNLWRLDDGRTIELGAVQHAHDVSKYRGRPHDLIAFDEATEFLEQQVRFLIGWLRTTIPGQRCRVVLTFNPPTNVEGQWVVRFFAPWLDETHHNPALPGELRWFATVDGQETERPDGEPFEHNGETIKPLSRTFYPAKLSDNPALANTSYEATLQSLPEPLRSQLLNGDFKAGIKDDPWQLIPTAWVKAAQERWRPDGATVLMTCIGLDVAHGGEDQTVLAPRFGDWFGSLSKHPGRQTPNGASAAALAVALIQGSAYINVDAIGYGASCQERLAEDHGLPAYAVNVAEKSDFRDRSGKYRMVNKRAEMYWRLREALDPEGDTELALPRDPELLADLTAPKYEITTAGIKVEAKADIKERLGGRSPDCGDAVALAMLPDMTGVWGFV